MEIFDCLPENVVEIIFQHCDLDDIINISTKRHCKLRFSLIGKHLQPLIQRKLTLTFTIDYLYDEGDLINITINDRKIIYEYWQDNKTIVGKLILKHHGNTQLFRITPFSYELYNHPSICRDYYSAQCRNIIQRNSFWTDFYDDRENLESVETFLNCDEENKKMKRYQIISRNWGWG